MGALDDLIAKVQGQQQASPLDALIASVQGGQRAPATPEQANSPEMPADGGKVIELPTQQIEGDPRAPSLEEQDHVLRMLRDPGYFGQQLLGTGGRILGAAVGAGGGSGIVAQGVRQGAAAGLSAGADEYGRNGDLTRALLAAGKAVPIGALTGAGLTSLSTGLSGVARGAGGVADEARIRAATGMPAGDLEAMGPAARADLASKIEGAGLQNGSGVMGSLLPQPTKTYVRNAQANLIEPGGARMRSAEDAINALPAQPNVDVSNIIADQRAEAARLRGLADQSMNAPQAGFRETLASNLEADTIRPGQGPQAVTPPSGWNGHQFTTPGQTVDLPSGELPWARALEQRRNLDANINWNRPREQVGITAANDATRKEVAGGLRGGIDQALNDPRVPPALASDWRAGRDQFSLGSDIVEPGLQAMNAQGGQGLPFSTREAAGQALRAGGRGQSMIAGLARSTQGAFNGGAAGADLTRDVSSQALTSWLGAKGVKLDQIQGAGRGNMLGSAAQQLLQSQPQALGRWQQQLEQAAQKGPEELDQLVGKLAREDPDFIAGPLVQLQQMTGGGQNGS